MTPARGVSRARSRRPPGGSSMAGRCLVGIFFLVLGVVGARYQLSTLSVTVAVTIVSTGIELAWRRPRALQLLDVWRMAFAYLFGSDVLLSLSYVRDDFGSRLTCAAEGFVVAAFGASLIGYQVGTFFVTRRRSAAPPAIRRRPAAERLVLFGLSALILLYLLVAVSPSEFLRMRAVREDSGLQGPAFLAVLAAMILQAVLTARAVATSRRRLPLLFPAAVAAISFVVIYGIGTRYFLGFFASGLLFFAVRFLEPLSRRRLVGLSVGVLALAAAQGTMRLVRGVGLGGAQTGTVVSSLGTADTYVSSEGMIRVHAWVHQKQVFAMNDRPPEHAFLLYWWVPRALWPSKPTMDGYWLAHEVMADGDVGAGHNVAGGFALPALLDFGPWFGIAFSLLYGLALCGLDRFAAHHRNPSDPLSILVALLPFAVFFGMRSPQTSMIFVECCLAVYAPILLLCRASVRRVRRSYRLERNSLSPTRVHRPAMGQVASSRLLQSMVVLIVVATSIGIAQADSSARPPAFAAVFRDGPLRSYQPADSSKLSDDDIEATVVPLGHDEWELTLTPKRGVITTVWFPWAPNQTTVAPRIDDAIVYYPRLLGVAERAALFGEWGWRGGDYPGQSFAPLIVMADDVDARMVAATNWPPRRVGPMYSLGRIALRYEDPVPAGERRSFRALVVHATRDAGEEPWQRAVDEYKRWLKERIQSAGLEPVPPPWLRAAHGWLNVQLENMPTWSPGPLTALWNRFNPKFPWVQFWGQMSDYAGRGHVGTGEVGCCLPVPALHERYRPQLVELAGRIRRDGHVGFYVRPRPPYAPFFEPGGSRETPDLQFLRDWLARNRSEYGANAQYIDVLGGRYFGDPLRIASLLKHELSGPTVIEYPVDLYPTAFLVSGSLGGGAWNGGPGRTPAELGRALTITTFPPFGRYLLDDRMFFLGESNRDGRFWGPPAEYWTERQAFLLGAKFDVIHPTEDGKPDGPENRALALAIAVRERSGWWERNPIYLDRQGLGALPADVDVRRYRDHRGETLLVVDNWHQRRGLELTVDGNHVRLPDDQLAIVTVSHSS